MSLNKVMLIGRLGKDPELKYTPGGVAVCNFTVATSESYKDKEGQSHEKTEWHKVVVWGKLAELCNQYLSKGRQAYIEGSLQTRSWEDKEGKKNYTTEINASVVQFLGNNVQQSSASDQNDEDAPKKSSKKSSKSSKGQDVEVQAEFTSDDIGF